MAEPLNDETRIFNEIVNRNWSAPPRYRGPHPKHEILRAIFTPAVLGSSSRWLQPVRSACSWYPPYSVRAEKDQMTTAVLNDTRVFDEIIKHGFGEPPLPPEGSNDDHGGGGDGDGDSPAMWAVLFITVCTLAVPMCMIGFLALVSPSGPAEEDGSMSAVLDDTRVFDEIIRHGFGDPPTPPRDGDDDHGGGGDDGGMERFQKLLALAFGICIATTMAYIAYLTFFG